MKAGSSPALQRQSINFSLPNKSFVHCHVLQRLLASIRSSRWPLLNVMRYDCYPPLLFDVRYHSFRPGHTHLAMMSRQSSRQLVSGFGPSRNHQYLPKSPRRNSSGHQELAVRKSTSRLCHVYPSRILQLTHLQDELEGHDEMAITISTPIFTQSLAPRNSKQQVLRRIIEFPQNRF